MKKEISILIVCQIVCIFPVLSQNHASTAQVKPATDACPSWGKKQIASKADYFAYLSKKPKPQDENNFYTPKYQNIVAKKTIATHTKKQERIATEDKQEEITKVQAPAVVPEKQNKPGKSEVAPIAKATVDQKQDVLNKAETTDKTDRKDKPPAPLKEKGKSGASSKKESKQTDQNKKTSEINHPRKHLFKKIGFRKKRAADCPEF